MWSRKISEQQREWWWKQSFWSNLKWLEHSFFNMQSTWINLIHSLILVVSTAWSSRINSEWFSTSENFVHSTYIVIVIVIHTFLWHRFKLNSWETLCYLYWVNKTLWERKSLVVYTTASRSWNNEIDTVLSSNESIASIQRVMLK